MRGRGGWRQSRCRHTASGHCAAPQRGPRPEGNGDHGGAPAVRAADGQDEPRHAGACAAAGLAPGPFPAHIAGRAAASVLGSAQSTRRRGAMACDNGACLASGCQGFPPGPSASPPLRCPHDRETTAISPRGRALAVPGPGGGCACPGRGHRHATPCESGPVRALWTRIWPIDGRDRTRDYRRPGSGPPGARWRFLRRRKPGPQLHYCQKLLRDAFSPPVLRLQVPACGYEGVDYCCTRRAIANRTPATRPGEARPCSRL